MASFSNGSEDAITGINVTPLVDITLVLLVVFMVTATYIVKDSIEVDLPRAAVKAAVARSKDARAIIGADKAVTHGRVVELIDLVKGEGLTHFAIDVAAAEAAGG